MCEVCQERTKNPSRAYFILFPIEMRNEMNLSHGEGATTKPLEVHIRYNGHTLFLSDNCASKGKERCPLLVYTLQTFLCFTYVSVGI